MRHRIIFAPIVIVATSISISSALGQTTHPGIGAQEQVADPGASFSGFSCSIVVAEDANFNDRRGLAIFYGSMSNFDGHSFPPSSDVPLGRPLNDAVSAFHVKSGEWHVCMDSDYRDCRGPYGSGFRETNLADRVDWNDKPSSIVLTKCDASVGGQACSDCPGNPDYSSENIASKGLNYVTNQIRDALGN